MTTAFKKWYAEADMPMKAEDGTWYDAETGFPFNPKDYETKPTAPRQTVSAKALECRKIAKVYGGKALKGTIKQKEWAETIRANRIAEMKQAGTDAEIIEFIISHINHEHSKFWIESRNETISQFVQPYADYIAARKQAAEVVAVEATETEAVFQEAEINKAAEIESEIIEKIDNEKSSSRNERFIALTQLAKIDKDLNLLHKVFTIGADTFLKGTQFKADAAMIEKWLSKEMPLSQSNYCYFFFGLRELMNAVRKKHEK